MHDYVKMQTSCLTDKDNDRDPALASSDEYSAPRQSPTTNGTASLIVCIANTIKLAIGQYTFFNI